MRPRKATARTLPRPSRPQGPPANPAPASYARPDAIPDREGSFVSFTEHEANTRKALANHSAVLDEIEMVFRTLEERRSKSDAEACTVLEPALSRVIAQALGDALAFCNHQGIGETDPLAASGYMSHDLYQQLQAFHARAVYLRQQQITLFHDALVLWWEQDLDRVPSDVPPQLRLDEVGDPEPPWPAVLRKRYQKLLAEHREFRDLIASAKK